MIASSETNPSDIPTDDLSQAIEKQREKRYDEAIVLFLEVFKKNKEELIGKYALTKIEECFTQSGRKDYLQFSEKEIKPNITKGNETYVIALELEAHQMINAEEYTGAINNLNSILTKYNLNEDIEKNTLFTLGSIYTLFTENKRDADNYFNTLKTKYPEDDLTSQIEIIKGMGESYAGNKKIMLLNPGIKSESVNNNEEISISNYPNPFNPTTIIEYNLPIESNVKLEVYNSLGQLVNVLVDGNQSAGRQRVTWNGKDSFGNSVSSGIYFYRIKTNSLSQIRKMILLK
jgi:tetratricopeptide (TPR) repeat protein